MAMAPADRLPPQNIDAERAVLGSILLENNALIYTLELLDPSKFYLEAHRKIFSAMVELFEKNTPIDLVTLTEKLGVGGQLEAIGGASYLAELLSSVPTAANVRYHARIVREKALLRNLITASTEIIAESYEDAGDVEELLDRAEQAIFEISEDRARPGFVNMIDLMKESIATVEKLYEQKKYVTGLETGFKDFDKLTTGLHSSELIIIAGRPSMGKTAFALNVACNSSFKSKKPIAIYSLEMSREQLGIRLLCSEARIDSNKLRSGYIAAKEWEPLIRAAGDLSDSTIYIDDSPDLSVLDIRAKSRRLQMEHDGLGLVIIDYLQLIRSRMRFDNRQQEVAEITRSLKGMAKELRVPVIVISQLSREIEKRDRQEPRLSDLRESGAIEQDADLVVFIYKKEDKEETHQEDVDKDLAEEVILRIGKQRNGPTGDVKVTFLKKFARFENYSGATAPAEYI